MSLRWLGGLLLGFCSALPSGAVNRTRVPHETPLDLDHRLASATPKAIPEHLQFELPDGRVASASLTRTKLHQRGGTLWIGGIEGDPAGQVVLLLRGGKVFGTVRAFSRVFRLAPSKTGLRITEIDDTLGVPAHSDFIELPVPARAEPRARPKGAAGTRIDLLMLYTPAAREAGGGHEMILGELDLAVAEVNTTFENSGIDLHLRLVHAQEVSYQETGDANLDVGRLRQAGDGFMDEAHSLRDTYGADVVGLWATTLGFPCGIAFQMLQVSASFAGQAFLAVRRTCDSLVLGHELGHNLAARHDWLNDDTSFAPYSYNHGHTSGLGGFDTMMAITARLRIPYWSNPDVSILGVPTGVPAGTSVQCTTADSTDPDCDADNRMTLANSAPVAAAFRPTRLIATLRKTASVSEVEPGETITYTLIAENATEMTATDVVITDVVPDGTMLDPTSLSGDALAEGTGAGSTIVWTTGADLAPGTTLTRSLTVLATGNGIARNVAGVSSSNSALTHLSNAVETTVLDRARCGFLDDFESGSLGLEWRTETTNAGRVRVLETDLASGSHAAALDNADSNAGPSEASLILATDLRDALAPILSFQWVDGGDEYDPDFDGVFIRESASAPWIKVFDFSGSQDGVIQVAELDLEALAAAAALTLTERFQVRFGFFDDFPFQYPVGGDGYLIDEVSLQCDSPTIFADGFES